MTDFKLKYQIVADAARAKAEVRDFDDVLKAGGGRIGGMGSAGVIAAAGVAAIGAAGITAGVALFNLTKNAADFGSEIFDASKKTGLGAEAISAMKFAADQSGTSLEAITGGVAKFSKAVGAAAEDAKKGAKFVKDFGITPQEAINDLDGALGKVFKKIMDVPPGVQRMTLAQKAFGRSGADLLPFLDSFDGDLGKLIRKAKDLGVTIDDEAARAADEFGDQLDTLNSQFAGVGRTIGQQFMPMFLDMAQGVSGWVTRNKDDIRSWGQQTADTLLGLIGYWKDYHAAVAGGGSYRLNQAGERESLDSFTNLFGVGGLLLRDRGTRQRMSTAAPAWLGDQFELDPATNTLRARSTPRALPGGAASPSGGGKGSGKKVADKLPAFGSMKSLVISSGNKQWDSWFNQMGQKYNVDPNVLLLQAGKESSFNAGAVSPKGAEGFSQFMPKTAARFGVDTSSVKDSIRGQAQYMGQLLSMFGGDYRKALAGYNAGEGAVQKYGGIPPYRETRSYVSKIQSAYRSKVQKGEGPGYGTFDFEGFLNEQAAAAAELEREIEEGLRRMADEMIAGEEDASSKRLAIRAKEADQALVMIEGMVSRGEMTELEAIQRVGQLRVDMLEEERSELEAQIPTEQNLHRLEELRLEIGTERLKNTNEELDYWKKIGDEINQQNRALEKRNQRPTTLKKRTGPGEGDGFLDQLYNATGQIKDMGDVWSQVGNMGTDIFMQLGQAIGSVVEQYVMLGEVSGEQMRQMVAQTLASVAAQAATYAIFHVAMGIAALTPWGAAMYGPAPLHFKAAAVWGAIAVGTALAGRAIAGDSGKSGGRGSSSSAGTSSGGREQDLRPYSRQSDDVYLSGRRTDPATLALARAVEKLEKKIGSKTAGEILVIGSGQKRGFIGRQTAEDMKTNPKIGAQILRGSIAR